MGSSFLELAKEAKESRGSGPSRSLDSEQGYGGQVMVDMDTER